jgi:hypothetical protein
MRRIFAALALMAALSACSSEGPFVNDLPYYQSGNITINKPPDPIRTTGRFSICYGDDKADQVQPLAVATCKEYGLEALRIGDSRYTCRLTAPEQAEYQCINPKMRWPNGTYINPLNPKDLQRWTAEQGGK